MVLDFSKYKNKNESLFLLLIIVAFLIIVTNLVILNFNYFLYFVGFLLINLFYVRITQKKYLGKALKVSEKHFYRVKVLADSLCEKINIEPPDIYILFDPYPNAFCLGFFKPYTIILTSSLIENLSEEELETVIAHELGHIYYEHLRISTLFNMITNQKNIFITLIYQLMLIGFWQRAAEYSADNFALILTKNPQAQISSLIKIHVSPKFAEKIDESLILNQYKASRKDLINILGELNETHPYFVKRVHNIIDLFTDLGYEYFERKENIFCVNCGKELEPNSQYCVYCGSKVI